MTTSMQTEEVEVRGVSAKMVSALREATGAPLMKCKAALVDASGDQARAEVVLRERGVSASPVPREGNQGYLAVYVHPGNQLVGMVELACTTDFVARSAEFRAVADELAMQVAAGAASAISAGDLSQAFRDSEIRIARAQLIADPKMAGKSEAMLQEIAAKKAAKRIEEQCLLTQAYIRDPKVMVGSLVDDLQLRMRESIYVRRIARWRVGESV